MKKILQSCTLSLVAMSIACLSACAADSLKVVTASGIMADQDNAGLQLPSGFGALVVADGLARPRHIVVSPQGDLFVKLNGKIEAGKGVLRLRDTNGDGKPDETTGAGNYRGTGIALKDGYLYASSDEEVYRYKLDDKGNVVDGSEQKIITGLINRRQHESKSIVLDDAGNIYVNIGAYSNSCQENDRKPGSKGRMPCPILDSAGGIWQFKADKLNQTYGDGVRYATGLRNVVGLDWNKQAGKLFVMQHGRDDLHNLFPEFYTEKDNAEKPAEAMYALNKGDNAGWPYIYFDPATHKKMLAPEYGGDGKKEAGQDAIDPAIAFPAHMAPNAMLFYTGNMFPARYKNGAFVAFHGSWNRAPLPQEGYYVVFVPFENGKPTGKWEVFADGFAEKGDGLTPRNAAHRPTGLAQGPDGSLYVSDDQKGTIYRIIYNGK